MVFRITFKDKEKEKHAAYMREYRRKHPKYKEKQRAYLRAFRKRHPNYDKKWKQRHKEQGRKDARNQKKRHPERVKARLRNRYLRLKDKCELCGSTEGLEHHHPNYSNPDNTVTLCRKCHNLIHK